MEKIGSVQALERALSLLEILAAHRGGMRLTHLAQAAGLPVSTCHRLLTTLERRGFAHFDDAHSHWQVGRQAFLVGMSFADGQNFLTAALPYLRHLRDYSRETANLGLLRDGEVITLAQVESREITRAIAAPGGRVPVMNSGMGKAIVATWSDAEIETLVLRHGLRPFTKNSLKTMHDVHIEIGKIRAQGYAFDDEEHTLGMRCVAAVVRSPLGEPIGALSVSALTGRMDRAQMHVLGEKVSAVAKDLSANLGAGL